MNFACKSKRLNEIITDYTGVKIQSVAGSNLAFTENYMNCECNKFLLVFKCLLFLTTFMRLCRQSSKGSG